MANKPSFLERIPPAHEWLKSYDKEYNNIEYTFYSRPWPKFSKNEEEQCLIVTIYGLKNSYFREKLITEFTQKWNGKKYCPIVVLFYEEEVLEVSEDGRRVSRLQDKEKIIEVKTIPKDFDTESLRLPLNFNGEIPNGSDAKSKDL